MRDLKTLATASLLALSLAGCDASKTNSKTENKTAAATKTASSAGRLCAANATYSRLKESAFDEAKRIRERDTESLDALADASVVRMENPLLESRDEALGLTVCSGRMILELPPGAGAAFDGRQRLAADITYSAQAAADGSGTVFKIDGGEPIVYRLAGFDPNRGATRTATIEGDDRAAPTPAPVVEPVEPEVEIAQAPVRVPTPPMVPPRPAPRPAPDPELAAERARDRAERTRKANALQAERTAAIAREDRDARIAAARRDERGEAERAPRATRAAVRPSFSCRYARSRVEKQICGSSDLASRDRAMANVYYRANDRADGPTRRALSASRLRFLAYRDRCGSAACVASAYEDRIAEINDIAGE